MKTLQELTNTRVPIVVIDPKLAELDSQVLFPEKVEKAQRTLAKIGLPNRKNNAQDGFGASGAKE